jgi:hypothetical protein
MVTTFYGAAVIRPCMANKQPVITVAARLRNLVRPCRSVAVGSDVVHVSAEDLKSGKRFEGATPARGAAGDIRMPAAGHRLDRQVQIKR